MADLTQVIWVERSFFGVFLNSGLTRTALKLEGKMPETRESLITEVLSGSTQSGHSSRKRIKITGLSSGVENSLTGSTLRRSRPWKQGSAQLGGNDA